MSVINPRHACARVTVVVLCVCLSFCVSITTLAATYLVYMLKSRWRSASYVIFYTCIVWISLKTFHSEVLVTFADHLCLLQFLTDFRCTKQSAMASFQDD